MDEKVAKWIIEFLLRKAVDEKCINRVLSCLPLSKNDNRLKKMILLRKVESETLNGSVSEKLLELLEIIEELDHREGKTASDLMKKAYCLVALDCTVRFLEENLEENGNYLEAVERIWRNRVCLMDVLASENSNRWLEDIESAVWDSGVCEKIWMSNTRNYALKAVKGYLKEAWEIMGPAFIELVAKKIGNELEQFCRGIDGGDIVVGSECCKSVVSQGTKKGKATVRHKHVAVKCKCPGGAKISDAEKGGGAKESMSVGDDVSAEKMNKVQETLQSYSMPLCAAVNDIHVSASQAACTASSAMGRGNMSNVNAVKNNTVPVKQSMAEVNTVKYALRSGSRGLHAAVTDPLPEALKIAETLSPTGVTGDHDTAVENQTGPKMHAGTKVDSVRQVAESSSVKACAADRNPSPDAFVPSKLIDKNIENIEKKVKLRGNTWGSGVDDQMERHKRNHSLMERNTTGHTLEWDDSIDNMSEGLPDRPCLLPSVNRSNASRLRQYEGQKFRRINKRWTTQEEDALRDAVKKLGPRWTVIRSCYSEVFNDRTNGDLRDKWRRMI